jgi:hypothetical protein
VDFTIDETREITFDPRKPSQSVYIFIPYPFTCIGKYSETQEADSFLSSESPDIRTALAGDSKLTAKVGGRQYR